MRILQSRHLIKVKLRHNTVAIAIAITVVILIIVITVKVVIVARRRRRQYNTISYLLIFPQPMNPSHISERSAMDRFLPEPDDTEDEDGAGCGFAGDSMVSNIYI